MLAFLLRDVWFRLCLLVWLAVAVLYLTPVATPATRVFFGDNLIGVTFIPLLIACCLAGVNGQRQTEESLFWRIIAGAYFIWFAYGVVSLIIPDSAWALSASVVGDIAYVSYYLLLLLAIELKPHLQTMNRLEAQQRRLRSTALTVLLFAWLCYVVVIPAAVDRRTYETLVPSFLLYLSLDLLLIARLMWVRRESWSVRWAALYGLLAGAAGAMFLGDVAETLYIADVIAVGSGTALDLLWTVPFMLVAAAARARHAPFETGQDILNQDWERQRVSRIEQWMMGGAILLPIVHQTLHAVGWLDANAEPYRDLLVEVTLVTLAILALLAFRLLEKDRRGVEEREAVLRRELDQARRMDAVARVAGAVAHDFSNLLHVIRGRVDLVTDELEHAHPAHDDLREIRAAAMRASAMAADLLAFGRRQPVTTEPLSLHAFIDELRRQMKLMAGERVTLTITLGASADRVSLDAVKFESVLLNLVANARNAMPAGGRIDVETWNPPTATGAGPRVAIAVRDSGQGMSAEVLERAFEPFFTTRRDQGGSGMGLSSAHGIIQAMGGSIRAESAPGKGTSVLIDLPLLDSPGADAAPAERPRGALLIMETDPHMRQMLRGYFADVWKPVLTSGNAMEALQIAGTPGQTISIVVTDTSPSGLTYDVLVTRLRALHPAMQVVLIVPEDFAGPAPEGCMLMREPLSLSELAEKLKAFER